MNHRNAILCSILAGTLAFSGCGTGDIPKNEEDAADTITNPTDTVEMVQTVETPDVADGLAGYQPILEKTVKLLSEGEEAQVDMDGMAGIFDAMTALYDENVFAQIGYCIEDISGDGIPELLLGMLAQEDGTGGDIFAVYTIADGAPICMVEGWYRNRYSLLEDGSFFYMGSAGAAYSIIGRYALSADGRTLECLDFYFTEPNDENWDENKYYYNTTGEYDVALAQEVTAEVYYQAERDWQAQTKQIAYTPFAAYAP